MGLLLNRATYGYDDPTDHVQEPWAQAYLESWKAWNGKLGAPRIGLSRIVYPSVDKRTAQAHLQEGVARFTQKMVKSGKFPAGLSIDENFKRLHAFYGHPDEVAAELATDRVFPHITDLICQFNPGVPSIDQALRAFELIATKVAPALGWRPNGEAENSQAESQPALLKQAA